MAVVTTLAVLLERLVLALRSLAIVVLVVVGVYALGRFVAVPAARRAADAAHLDDTLTLTVVKVTGASFALLGLYLALPLSGLATTPTTVAAISAGVTIAIGFAARDLLSNLVSGAILVVDPGFRVGDWIAWHGQEGIIEDIGFRVTRVHTFANELVTVPNAQLTQHAVTNPVSKDRRRLGYEVGIGYGDDIDHARSVMLEAARDHPDVLDRPAANVVLAELGESAVVLEALFWIADPARAEVLRIRSEYAQSLKERFDAEGIELPYPYRELTGSVGTWPAAPTGSR